MRLVPLFSWLVFVAVLTGMHGMAARLYVQKAHELGYQDLVLKVEDLPILTPDSDPPLPESCCDKLTLETSVEILAVTVDSLSQVEVRAAIRDPIPKEPISLAYHEEGRRQWLATESELTLQALSAEQVLRIPLANRERTSDVLFSISFQSTQPNIKIHSKSTFQVKLPRSPDPWIQTNGPRVILVDTKRLRADPDIHEQFSQLLLEKNHPALYILCSNNSIRPWSNDIVLGGADAYEEFDFEHPFNTIGDLLHQTSDLNRVIIVWSNHYAPEGAPKPSQNKNRIVHLLWLNQPTLVPKSVEGWLGESGEITPLYSSSELKKKILDMLSQREQ